MGDKLKKFGINQIVIPLIVLASLFYLFLIILKNPPLFEQELVNITASKSLLSNSVSNLNFKNFLNEKWSFTQPLTVIINFIIINLLPHTTILFKLPGIILFSIVAFIYFKAFILSFNSYRERAGTILITLLLLTSPWLIQSAIFKPNTLLSLGVFILTSFHLRESLLKNRKSNTKCFYLLNTLLALTGLAGFISSVSFFVILFITKLSNKKAKKIDFKLLILMLVTLLGIFFINKAQYPKILQDGSLFTKVSPIELAHSIDERQMIDYLAANKNFILPRTVRKFTYNKLSYGIDVTIRKAISLFDFEQYASSNESYDIIKLSGILPKGNIPLMYIWEIPLFIFGMFLIFKNHNDKRFWYTTIFIASIIPALVFEKKDFAEYGIFIHTPIFIAEVFAISSVLSSLREVKYLKKAAAVIVVITIIISSLSFFEFLLYSDFHYLRSDLTAYQKISNWLKDDYDKDSKYVITNRFGPTQYAIPAYLNSDFENYWENYNPESTNYSNFTFEQIDYSATEPEKEVYYIGFPGEFLGELDTYSSDNLPSYYELIGTLELNDELVYQFGKDIWVVKPR